MKKPEFPPNWHAALRATQADLPWREAQGGALVLGAEFPTTTPSAPVAADSPPAVPEPGTLATPLVANPAASPAQQWGEQVHRALQGLPVVAAPAVAAAAQALAERVHAALPWLFGPGSAAEVEVLLPDAQLGRIDRVVLTPDAVWVIDFKTGTPLQPVPDAYQAQLRGYAAALQAEPGAPPQPLRLGLVWLEAEGGPALVEIPLSA